MTAYGSEITRIVGSSNTIKPSEIASVLGLKNTRGAVEHILTSLNHKDQPGNKNPIQRISPGSYIDTPETALLTLEILFQGQEDIFDRRNIQQAEQVGNCLWYLLCEYHGNTELYDRSIPKDPESQKKSYVGQQRLTDAFHYITGNIINRSFNTFPQYGKISPFDIKLTPEIIQSIEKGSDFPNVVQILRTFGSIYSQIQDSSNRIKAA